MLPALGHCRVAFCTSDSLLAAYLKQLFEAWQVQHEAYADRQSLLTALQGPVNWTHLLLDHHLLPAAGLALPADVQGLALVPLGAEAEAARCQAAAYTAHAFSEDRENSLKAGFSDYIAKPFLPEDLVQMVQRWRPENLSQA